MADRGRDQGRSARTRPQRLARRRAGAAGAHQRPGKSWYQNKYIIGGFGIAAAVILVVTLVVIPQDPTTVGSQDPPVRRIQESAETAADGEAATDQQTQAQSAAQPQQSTETESAAESQTDTGDGMPKTYSERPPLALTEGVTYHAVFEMEAGGSFEVELFADAAPETVNSFVFLAREGFYDGLTFHRVIDGFVAQGGDPQGTGTGGPGYNVPRELSDHKHVEGAIAMARSQNPDSAGSQFYICLADVPFLDGEYAVFGMVRSGMDVVHDIPKGEPPANPGVIKSITIEER